MAARARLVDGDCARGCCCSPTCCVAGGGARARGAARRYALRQFEELVQDYDEHRDVVRFGAAASALAAPHDARLCAAPGGCRIDRRRLAAVARPRPRISRCSPTGPVASCSTCRTGSHSRTHRRLTSNALVIAVRHRIATPVGERR